MAKQNFDDLLPATMRPARRKDGSRKPKGNFDDLLPPSMRKARQQAKPNPAPRRTPDWVPEEFVLFWCASTCSRCGSTFEGPEYGGQTFIRLRQVHGSRLRTQRYCSDVLPVDTSVPTRVETRHIIIHSCPTCVGRDASPEALQPSFDLELEDERERKAAIRSHYNTLLTGEPSPNYKLKPSTLLPHDGFEPHLGPLYPEGKRMRAVLSDYFDQIHRDRHLLQALHELDAHTLGRPQPRTITHLVAPGTMAQLSPEV